MAGIEDTRGCFVQTTFDVSSDYVILCVHLAMLETLCQDIPQRYFEPMLSNIQANAIGYCSK